MKSRSLKTILEISLAFKNTFKNKKIPNKISKIEKAESIQSSIQKDFPSIHEIIHLGVIEFKNSLLDNRLHVESIANYYPQLLVNRSADVNTPRRLRRPRKR